ncbi:hypothetical protein SDC9_150704 [bioreactor metagenome]|uniref:Uncharacterized protein n=1 Tax=bioreactor metagenome TaxID=1076179 RepID=A0A645ESJ0_9ZZZZ
MEGGTILVNFLNGTGTSLAPGETIPGQLTRPAWPALTEDIEFLLPGIKAQTVYAVSPDFEGHKALPFSVSTDGLHVTLPKELLKAYTIVYIK